MKTHKGITIEQSNLAITIRKKGRSMSSGCVTAGLVFPRAHSEKACEDFLGIFLENINASCGVPDTTCFTLPCWRRELVPGTLWRAECRRCGERITRSGYRACHGRRPRHTQRLSVPRRCLGERPRDVDLRATRGTHHPWAHHTRRRCRRRFAIRLSYEALGNLCVLETRERCIRRVRARARTRADIRLRRLRAVIE